eukprot:gene11369-23794_t
MVQSVLGNYERSPISLKKFTSNKIAVAGAVTAAAIVGKYLSDGPTFSESVDMTGKTVVITGANTGLGKETAIKLAGLGADVIILCKTPEKGAIASQEINARSGSTKCRSLPLDLSSLNSVKKCSELLSNSVDKIDVLVNNAGVMALPQRQVTADGFEAHLGINHLGHFALTSRLMPLLKRAGNARIVNVASLAHVTGHLDFDDLMLEKKYEPWPAYGNSKLANILFTKELAKRLEGTNVITTVCHP